MILRRPSRILLPLALLAFLFVAEGVLCTAQAVDVGAAFDDLAELKKATKPRATNEDLEQYLKAVFTAFKSLDEPEAPAKDASDEEKKAYASAKAKFDKDQAKFRKDAEKLILKILTLKKVKNETNIRDDINTQAARILGDMAPILDEKGRKVLSKKIMQAIEKKLTKIKGYTLSSDHLEAAFEALGKLNDRAALQWMLKNYTHTNEVKKMYLIAAHKALLKFKDVPGKLRYEVCATFIKNYAGVESQAAQTSNDPKLQQKKRFWDDIKTGVIPVVQYYAMDADDNPAADAEGNALAKMLDFQAWMRDHKSLRRAPWVDNK